MLTNTDQPAADGNFCDGNEKAPFGEKLDKP